MKPDFDMMRLYLAQAQVAYEAGDMKAVDGYLYLLAMLAQNDVLKERLSRDHAIYGKPPLPPSKDA